MTKLVSFSISVLFMVAFLFFFVCVDAKAHTVKMDDGLRLVLLDKIPLTGNGDEKFDSVKTAKLKQSKKLKKSISLQVR